jgi:hypothetical protein
MTKQNIHIVNLRQERELIKSIQYLKPRERNLP